MQDGLKRPWQGDQLVQEVNDEGKPGVDSGRDGGGRTSERCGGRSYRTRGLFMGVGHSAA